MGFFEKKWRLVACRVQNGYTQREVADHIGITEKTLINWESGKTAPNMEKAQMLSELYGIPLAYIDFTKEGNGTVPKDLERKTGVTI